MKKVILAVAAIAMLSVCTSSADAGWRRYRRAVVGPVVAPVVAPVVVRPYVAPVYVARPTYVVPPVVVPRPVYTYGSYYGPTRVRVRSVPVYGGGVRIQTRGFGLNISY